MTQTYIYTSLHQLDCTPIERLHTAILYQAFADYVHCCRVIRGELQPSKDYEENPYFELKRIREFLSDRDQGGILINALGDYVKLRGTKDMFGKRKYQRKGTRAN